MAEYGMGGCAQTSIYVPKVMQNQLWSVMAGRMGGKSEHALNYLPIVPKASIYVPKVMHKPVMGGNTMSETFTHMFLFRSASWVKF